MPDPIRNRGTPRVPAKPEQDGCRQHIPQRVAGEDRHQAGGYQPRIRHGCIAPLLPPDAIARHIADSQLSLVEAWVLGRPACELAAVAEALRRGSSALLNALAAPADAATTLATPPT